MEHFQTNKNLDYYFVSAKIKNSDDSFDKFTQFIKRK